MAIKSHLFPPIGITPLYDIYRSMKRRNKSAATGGAAVWRPVVRRYTQRGGREAAPCGGRAVTVKRYGKSHFEGPEESLPQHREEKEAQEGRRGQEDQSADHR